MKSEICLPALMWALIAIMTACDSKTSHRTDFTKADSVTENYLALQDTMLQVWNTMIHDDNRKIKAMHHLLHELDVSNPEKKDDLKDFEERLNDLPDLRYDQRSMSDAEIVTEYDFASNSVVTELVALAESQPQFAYNTTLQKLVESIRAADQRVMNYRAEYDEIATRYNRFIERNKNYLEELQYDSFPPKIPLFQMAAE